MKLKAHLFGSTRAAFTLIELLIVIAIIVILAGLLLQTAGYIQEKAGRGRAEAEIKSIESALEAYKLENGTYPSAAANGSSAQDSSTAVLVKELAITPPGNLKPFEFPIKMLSAYRPNSGQKYEEVLQSPGCYLIDPFGNAYHYQFPGKEDRNGKNLFDLWSQGKKNNPNASDQWIKNW